MSGSMRGCLRQFQVNFLRAESKEKESPIETTVSSLRGSRVAANYVDGSSIELEGMGV